MSNARRPEVFISATSADLRSCRELIKQALLTLGCVPVEQTNFPPDYRTVRDMLRAKIQACDAVIHLAGIVYGAEPQSRMADEPRRSYTQMEYDLARELKKPLYVFVCGEDFAYDEHTPEPEDKRALQQAHREAVATGETLRYKVHTRDELALKVRELQTAVEKLGEDLRKARSWLGRGVAVGLILAAALGGGFWWLKQRADTQDASVRDQAKRAEHTEARVAGLETELEKQRRYLKSVADAFTAMQSQLRKLQLNDAMVLDRAIATVAEHEGVPTEELRKGIDLFVAAVRSDPAAGFVDQALAAFAEQNFQAAALAAGEAAQIARRKRLAAEQLVSEGEKTYAAAAAEECEYFKLQGQSYLADSNYDAAAKAFTAALAVLPPNAKPAFAGRLHADLGIALVSSRERQSGANLADTYARAETAFTEARRLISPTEAPGTWSRASIGLATLWIVRSSHVDGPTTIALENRAMDLLHELLQQLPPSLDPRESAYVELFLAEVLLDRARFRVGLELIAILDEARAAADKALQYYQRDKSSMEWAFAQLSLAGIKVMLADSGAPDARRLRQESDQTILDALTILNREDFPGFWAASQRNLSLSHSNAAKEPGADKAAELAAAITHVRAALEVFTRDKDPREWADAMNSLGIYLHAQADIAASTEAPALLAESIATFRAALEIHTREQFPQNWAQVQNNLGRALLAAAAYAEPAEAGALIESAIATYREALKIRTREHFPKYWSKTQRNLAIALVDQARVLSGKAAADAYFESIKTRIPLLDFYKEQNLITDWAYTQADVSYAYMMVANMLDRPHLLLRLSCDAMWLALENLPEENGTEWFEDRMAWLQRTEQRLAKAGLPREQAKPATTTGDSDDPATSR